MRDEGRRTGRRRTANGNSGSLAFPATERSECFSSLPCYQPAFSPYSFRTIDCYRLKNSTAAPLRGG
jgi:hypothetical protein